MLDFLCINLYCCSRRCCSKSLQFGQQCLPKKSCPNFLGGSSATGGHTVAPTYTVDSYGEDLSVLLHKWSPDQLLVMWPKTIDILIISLLCLLKNQLLDCTWLGVATLCNHSVPPVDVSIGEGPDFFRQLLVPAASFPLPFRI